MSVSRNQAVSFIFDDALIELSSQIAEQKLYDHWKQNAVELREVSIHSDCWMKRYLINKYWSF